MKISFFASTERAAATKLDISEDHLQKMLGGCNQVLTKRKGVLFTYHVMLSKDFGQAKWQPQELNPYKA